MIMQKTSLVLMLGAVLLQSALLLAASVPDGGFLRKSVHRRGLSPFNPVTVEIDKSIRPASDDAKDFAAYPGWKTFMGKARSVKGYKLMYTGERSVSPFSSTIISTAVFPTAAAASCAKRCDSNPFCGAIELFVERAPISSPEPAAPNPPPTYQFVCRLHNKRLAASDARHSGRFYQAFYRTQTNVLFQNRIVFQKSYGAKLDQTCTSDSTCGIGFACSTMKKCKLALGQPCSSGADDGKCVTGLCSSTGPFARTQCIAQGQMSVSKDKHCLTNNDCESQNCLSSTKVCGTKPLTAKCFDHFECETQFCSYTGSEINRNVGVCANIQKVDGAQCRAKEDCKSLYCDSRTNKCGRRANGEECTTADDCGVFNCDVEKKVCGLSDGQTCTENANCVSNFCGPDNQCAVLKRDDGSECSLDEECKSAKCGLADNAPSGSPTTCQAPAPPMPCNSNKDCSNSAATLLFCNQETKFCEVRGGCASDADCPDKNCDLTVTPSRCGKTSGTICDQGLSCSVDYCDLNAFGGPKCGKPDGVFCSTGSQCSSLFCRPDSTGNQNACARKNLTDGEKCLGDDMCAGGKCSRDLGVCVSAP